MRSVLACFVLCLFAHSAAAAEPEPTVVGGSTVPKGRWPDVVAVLLADGVCTGTLIAPDLVVTAAHCIDADPVEVVVGTVDYAKLGGERIAIASARAYPDWFRRYDVGVLVLERPARAAPRTVAATCTAREYLVPQQEVTLVGFGAATAGGSDANTRLREAVVPITDPTCTLDAACEPSLAPHGEFMAGGQGADSCFGDSGGPVYVETEQGVVLLGIVSRGLAVAAAPCGGGGVYVRADKVAGWIKRVTGRTLSRTTCEGRGDGAPGSVEDGGCSTGGGNGGLALLLVCFVTYNLRPWPRRSR